MRGMEGGCGVSANEYSQGVTKRCRLSWLINSVLVYEPKCGGGREFAVSQPMCTGAQIHFGDPTDIKPMYVCLHATCICAPKSRKIQFTDGKSGNDKITPSATCFVLYLFLRNIKETKRLLETTTKALFKNGKNAQRGHQTACNDPGNHLVSLPAAYNYL
jgi:hypothetical protein